MKKRICHIISKEKFTYGYISFFSLKMNDFKHIFYVINHYGDFQLPQRENIYLVSNPLDLIQVKKYLNNLYTADKIIISGVFYTKLILACELFRNRLIKKTYLHFWGGDFYCYAANNKTHRIRQKIKRVLLSPVYRNAAGLIFLIKGEYERFVKLLGIENRNFIAPVPDDPQDKRWFELINEAADHQEVRILLGNSRVPTNCHEEAINALAKYKDKDIRVFCPLSYPLGNNIYRESIIKIGHETFGDKFIPMLEFLPYNEYRRFLASIDIGVFANNRQQAMGNIGGLVQLGKKVYIKQDTSMWQRYSDENYIIFDFNQIFSMSFEEFIHMAKKVKKANINTGKQTNYTQAAKEAWSLVLNDEGK